MCGGLLLAQRGSRGSGNVAAFQVGEANIAAIQESRPLIAFSDGKSDTFGGLPPLTSTIENHL